MTFVHESGHIICGYVCGGTLQNADLVPWHLPYSIFEPDPHPLVTLWGGPILGVVIPTTVAFAIRSERMWFIAHFCILANGAYIAAAWVSGDRYLDTPKLLEHGASPILISIYCLLTIGFGYVDLTPADIKAGVLSCQTISLGASNPKTTPPNHRLRLICVKCSPHTSRGRRQGRGYRLPRLPS